MTRRSKSTLLKSRQRGYLRAVTRDQGVGVCLPCGEAFPTAELWFEHNKMHVARGERLCAVCSKTWMNEAFSVHPCIARTLSAETAAPSPPAPRAGDGPHGTEQTPNRRHLRVAPSPADIEDGAA